MTELVERKLQLALLSEQHTKVQRQAARAARDPGGSAPGHSKARGPPCGRTRCAGGGWSTCSRA